MERIIPFIGKNIIKVLTGQRRVGKSYMLFQIMDYLSKNDKKPNIIYINKEDLAFDGIKTYSDLNDYVKTKIDSETNNYLFVDEIQDIQQFEKALRSLILKKNVDIYCTGSNGNLLSGEMATYLSGRHITIPIYSLSYPEFLLFHKLDETEDSFLKYIKYGGLPYLVNLTLNNQIVFEYLKNIYLTIIYRDVVSRYHIRGTRLLEQLLQFLADNIGSIFSSKKISDFLKSQKINISPNQILTYLDYLANAYLIQRVSRYDLIGKRIFDSGEKYYFENLGIRNAIIGFKPNDLGKILENIVYNKMKIENYDVRIGKQNGNEIDFVCERNNEKIYLQVTLKLIDENTIEREFGNLLKIDDNFPKKVITMDNFLGNTYKGIEHQNIREFLVS